MADQPKPYRIKARIQNNRLWAAIRARFLDVKTQNDAARALDLTPQVFGKLLNMLDWPYRDQKWSQADRKHLPVPGYWLPLAQKVSLLLGYPEEYLFDGELYGRKAHPLEFEISTPRWRAALESTGVVPSHVETPLEALEQKEERQAVEVVLKSLSPRERRVLELRFGMTPEPGELDKTLEEVGKDFGVTRDRIRQIESRALQKLRHPSKTKVLVGKLPPPKEEPKKPDTIYLDDKELGSIEMFFKVVERNEEEAKKRKDWFGW